MRFPGWGQFSQQGVAFVKDGERGKEMRHGTRDNSVQGGAA